MKKIIAIVAVAFIIVAMIYMDVDSRYTKQKVNMRDNTSESSVILATLPENTKVLLLGQKGHWMKVLFNGKIGYIYDSYLQESDSSENVSESTQSDSESERSDLIEQWREKAISYCQDHMGDIYSQDHRDDDGYCDCSSLMNHAFQDATGEDIGDYTMDQNDNMADYLYAIDSIYDVNIGDIVYYMPGYPENHCGIYIGNGQVINASSNEGKVVISTFTDDNSYWDYGCNAAAYCYDKKY